MVTSQQCLKKYGEPSPQNSWLTIWDIPTELEVGIIPKKLWCNKDLIVPLSDAIKNIISRNLVSQLKTWDGCVNIRKKRGGSTYSLHSWGIAVDINAFENGFGAVPKMTPDLVKCFTDAGFDWGGSWKKPDGMHFQLSKI